MSRGGWPFLTFGCDVGVVEVGIVGQLKGFRGFCPDFVEVLPGEASRVKRCAGGQG